MDIVERLRSLKSDEYIENLVGKAADEIERLREQVDFERASLQAAFGELRKLDGDIERLHQQNAELVEALENAANGYRDRGHEGLEDMCRAAIAKATGGE